MLTTEKKFTPDFNSNSKIKANECTIILSNKAHKIIDNKIRKSYR